MKRRGRSRRGQSVIEYAVAVFCFVAAVLAMQAYISRGMQGKMRQNADSIGEQYDRTRTSGSGTYSHNSNTNTVTNTTEINGVTNTTIRTTFSESESVRRTETIGP